MATRVVSASSARAAMREARRQARTATRSMVLLVVPMALLTVVGLGVILSSSSVLSLRESGDGLFYFKRQVAWLLIGGLGMGWAAFIPLRWWRRMAFPLFLATIGLLVAVLMIGTHANGAQRWITAGPLSIQPSEIAKLTTILFLATWVSRRETSVHRFIHFFWPVAASVGAVFALIMWQPDLGTAVLIACAVFAVLASSAVPLGYVAGSGLLAAGASLALAFTSPYRWARVTAFLDLESDPLDLGYQAVQSLVALGTGGMWGVGLGASRARWSFLPNAHTDFVFAILGEETGFAGSIAVVLLFGTFTVAGVAVAMRAADRFGRLVAIGITTWISTQALVNIGGVTGVLPITGVPLPFVSYGGTALVTSMVGVGILISVARDRPQITVTGR